MDASYVKECYPNSCSQVESAWNDYLDALQQVLNNLETEVEAAESKSYCTEDWCRATEKILEDFFHLIFSLHVPSFIQEHESEKLYNLKKKVQRLYTRFRSASDMSVSGL